MTFLIYLNQNLIFQENYYSNIVFKLFNIFQNLHKTPQFTLIKPQPKNEITINIMMHFDKVLTDKLVKEYGAKTRKKLKIISNGILKDVENFYRHPSLNQNIKFKLKDTRFLKNNTKIVKMDENGSLYLKSYCEWQGKRKLVNDWYYSVLLTGLDLYYLSKNGEEVRRSTGIFFFLKTLFIYLSCSRIRFNFYIILKYLFSCFKCECLDA